jgi:ABC-2 type transport system permease protein
MWERILQIVRKEFRQTLREPRARAILIGPPILQLLVFGHAVNLDVERARIGWMDQDATPASRELRAAFEGSRYFDVVSYPSTDAELIHALDSGAARAVVRVHAGFGTDVGRRRGAAVQILVDGTDSNTASIVSSYAARIVAGYGNRVAVRQQQALLAGRTPDGAVSLHVPQVRSEARVWFNPDLRSRNYFVPGIIASIILLVTLMLTSMAIVREKEIGTMEQLMVTPIRPLELILGKTLPFACVGLGNMIMVTLLGLAIFRVPFRGSALLLLVSTILFLMSSLGAGLFISTISNTQQQAMMSSFFFFQPAFMLSGFAFPIRNMPEPVQWLTFINPVRYFMEIARGLFLKGSGFETLWPQMLALLALGVTILGLSVLRFHKRLD